MGGSGGVYEVRRAWTRAGVSWFAAAAVLIGVCFVPHVEPADTDHIELVFAPFALWVAGVCSSRRVAVRVGEDGITLCRVVPFRKPEFVGWADVVAVDWSDDEHFWGRTSRLTLYRRTPRPVAALPGNPGLEGLDAYLATQVDPDFVATFRSTIQVERGTTLTDVDPARLAAALTALAPTVRHFGDLGDLGGATPATRLTPGR
ncbi:hypothetical protein [Streptomyces sp. CA-111067]|uniref:hypothetical protein n=1 Tax=Streptomyces sp. CA-111067 TaxID=3240046 RepID=UPI003D96E917